MPSQFQPWESFAPSPGNEGPGNEGPGTVVSVVLRAFEEGVTDIIALIDSPAVFRVTSGQVCQIEQGIPGLPAGLCINLKNAAEFAPRWSRAS